MKPALTDFDIEPLQSLFETWGCKPSHAARLLRDFYNTGGELRLEQLRIGNALSAKFQSEIPLRQSRVARRLESADSTLKLLLEFERGGAAETVLMPTGIPARAAGCVSSQIGCAMGCDFCASTRLGMQRNLEPGEIVEQFLHLRREALLTRRRLHTLVFMGMGEPLLNLDNVLCAIRRIAGESMGALGWRQVTISTVGIVPGIERLIREDLNVNLALSLHAPDDETRARIVPMTRHYGVAEIMAATRRFAASTGLITNIEYCLLGGVNDSDDHARALSELLNGFRTHVNLIPYNSIGAGLSGKVYERPAPERVESFLAILRGAGVVAHARVTRGDDVNAACGQLAASAIAVE